MPTAGSVPTRALLVPRRSMLAPTRGLGVPETGHPLSTAPGCAASPHLGRRLILSTTVQGERGEGQANVLPGPCSHARLLIQNLRLITGAMQVAGWLSGPCKPLPRQKSSLLILKGSGMGRGSSPPFSSSSPPLSTATAPSMLSTSSLERPPPSSLVASDDDDGAPRGARGALAAASAARAAGEGGLAEAWAARG